MLWRVQSAETGAYAGKIKENPKKRLDEQANFMYYVYVMYF